MPDGSHQRMASQTEEHARVELGRGIAKLGFEIVDIAGTLSEVDTNSSVVLNRLEQVVRDAKSIGSAIGQVDKAASAIAVKSTESVERVADAMAVLKTSAGKGQTVASWVQDLAERIVAVEDQLKSVQKSARKIEGIASEINILAINARIEAARAGDHGRGFAVVAESIGQLSNQTAKVTHTITEDIDGFAKLIGKVRSEAGDVSGDAAEVLTMARKSDEAISGIADDIETTRNDVTTIAEEAARAGEASERFDTVLSEITGLMQASVSEMHQGNVRVTSLIDQAEFLVQKSADSGLHSDDAAMIERAKSGAATLSAALEDAVDQGDIRLADLFDETYRPIPGTDPEQVETRFSALTDQLFQDVQEDILKAEPRIVFCAAVDRNGYLPTHNLKFSHPQSDDPVWNAANCRNRRIFNDRVGLKAGQSTAPFLLQVHRRDMGGGQMVLMQDLSAPITVRGRHWGGLRVAYRPD